MLTVLVRTLIIYFSLILTMRFMGKRQLGELEISDLVTTLLLSEIASLPITNTDIPLSHALIPILTLTSLEVVLSGAVLKVPFLKRLFTIRPAILWQNGKPVTRTMREMRLSSEELLSQLRQKDVTDPGEIAYAILEPNGQISVVKCSSAQAATAADVGAEPRNRGMMHTLISDGVVNQKNLSLSGRSQAWLAEYLQTHGLRTEDVFLLLADDGEEIRLYPRGQVS